VSESQDGIVRMAESGTVARVTFHPDGRYEVQEIVEKASALRTGVREAGHLIATMRGDDSAGSPGSYARVDLQ
jgi:hypothetical protein